MARYLDSIATCYSDSESETTETESQSSESNTSFCFEGVDYTELCDYMKAQRQAHTEHVCGSSAPLPDSSNLMVSCTLYFHNTFLCFA